MRLHFGEKGINDNCNNYSHEDDDDDDDGAADDADENHGDGERDDLMMAMLSMLYLLQWRHLRVILPQNSCNWTVCPTPYPYWQKDPTGDRWILLKANMMNALPCHNAIMLD